MRLDRRQFLCLLIQGGLAFSAARSTSARCALAHPVQLILKFIVSHPAVTCAILATSTVHHIEDNMQANFGGLPDSAMRSEIESWFRALTTRGAPFPGLRIGLRAMPGRKIPAPFLLS